MPRVTTISKTITAKSTENNLVKKRSLFTKWKRTSIENDQNKLEIKEVVSQRRRSKSCTASASENVKEFKISESESDYCDIISKESLDIIGGYPYKSKVINKNGNVSSGIESIASWSDIEAAPVFYSSIIQQ